MLVAGADGCRGGWVVVTAELSGSTPGLIEATVAPRFSDLLALTSHCAAIAVDIPIGLSDSAPRGADAAARRLLGSPRSSSVFPAPPRAVLACSGYAAACDASFEARGKRLSRQSFGILPKIRETDACLTPILQARVREAHPEVSFAMLNGGWPFHANKKTPAGSAQRAVLLRRAFGAAFAALVLPRGAAPDDLYDATVLAWTAARIALGEAVSLPAEPEWDSRGLRMEIVY